MTLWEIILELIIVDEKNLCVCLEKVIVNSFAIEAYVNH